MPKYKGVATLTTRLEFVVEANNAQAAWKALVQKEVEDWDEDPEGTDFHLESVELMEEEQ